MKKILYVLTILTLFAMGIWITACGEGGTETGNPQIQDQGDATGGDDETGETSPVSEPASTTAEQILVQICSKLTDCFRSLDETSCREGLLETDNLDDDLGLDVSFDSYAAIIEAETAGTITPNNDMATTCLDEIGALECPDPVIQAAYSEASPDNFRNVHSMIPNGEDSCEEIY